MGILSIQSAVAYGHVGNSAAAFPLQRLGFDVWPVNTVQFSNHTGYGAWRGHVHTAAQVDEIVRGVAERGALPRCEAVLSGYLGDAELGISVLNAVAAVRAERPDALYACDPVMGDEGRGFFVRPGIPEFFASLAVPAADIVTPNAFELSYLAGGHEVRTLDDAIEAAEAVRAKGPRLVVATSVMLSGAEGQLAVLADCADGAWVVRTPLLPATLNGTGDAFTALFVGHYLLAGDVPTALERAVSAMYAIVEATYKAEARELRIVATQDQITAPARLFRAERVVDRTR
ncbi:MAG TPA: pyridoxal kinase PdxY [Geminicoccaceae bacterium]|nr:pyridoxal kinase PdxY [Geminicoccaceae bacterium]